MSLSGKSILCFSGRIHHWKRLRGVMMALREAGANAQWVISDNATNMDPAVEYMIPSREPFIHVMDFLDPNLSQASGEMTRRILSGISHNDLSSDATSDIDPFWLSFSIREAAEFIYAFAALIGHVKPDLVMVLHEANYWGKMISFLCRARPIPCVAFQEGKLRLRDQQTQGKFSLSCEYSSHVFLWSDGAKRAYIEAGVPESKLSVVGIPHLDEWIRLRADAQQRELFKKVMRGDLGFGDGKLVTFCPPQAHRYEGNLVKTVGILADWSASTYSNLAIRLHPFDEGPAVNRIKDALASHPYAKVVECDTIGLMAASDLVLTQHSTVGVEAIALGIPVAEIDFQNVGILESIVEDGAAHSIRAGEYSKLNDILSGKKTLRKESVDKWRDENVGPTDGKSTERVVTEIEGMV